MLFSIADTSPTAAFFSEESSKNSNKVSSTLTLVHYL